MRNGLLKVLTIALFILACEQPAPEIDISGTELSLKMYRLEQDLFADAPEQLNREYVQMLEEKYGQFFKLFVEQIISVGKMGDSITTYYLNHFKTDPQVSEVAQACLNEFPDMEFLRSDLENAFKRYAVLFPERPIPTIYTFISAFSYTLVADDQILGVGLDMYLGEESNYYERLGIPKYRVHRMNRNNIAVDCMRSWISTEFELPSENQDLLAHMVYHGKILYALDLMLPGTTDSLKMGYTSQQIQWVNMNEKEMWFHLAEKNLFYDKDPKQINKYIGEAPFTPGFPEGSPGMTGRWIGWQIVRKYMQQNQPLDLRGLFAEGDADLILSESGYKPN